VVRLLVFLFVVTETFSLTDCCDWSLTCDAVEQRSPAAQLTAAAAAAAAAAADDDDDDDDNSDKDDIASDDADDDEYGFDPKLHIWHPPENPVITEEKPDGIFFVIIRCVDNYVAWCWRLTSEVSGCFTLSPASCGMGNFLCTHQPSHCVSSQQCCILGGD